MNRLFKKFAVSAASAALLLGQSVSSLPVYAAEESSEEQTSRTESQCIADLIAYYRDYQESAATDIERVLAELSAINPTTGAAWSQIMDYWSYINTEMTVNTGVLPDGLPDDDSLCIVILGFGLNDDGSMKDELIGRLTVGLESAKKYPNAYVAVTGGGTAKNNKEVTEGGQMAAWLLEQGLDESRLIVENTAPTTVGNAKNTFAILNEKYPQVKHLAMVTSDYHIPRGCILFYSTTLLAAVESGEDQLDMVSNAGYVTGTNGYESIALQASGVAQVAGININNVSTTLSQLRELYVDNASLSDGKVILSAKAVYDSGYEKDVTDSVEISDFVPEAGANQTVTVTYSENGKTVTAYVNLLIGSASGYDKTFLMDLIEEYETIGAGEYTADSYAALQDEIRRAKGIYSAEDSTLADLENEYEALKTAKDALVHLDNVALNASVTASCNQSNAYKITDGVVTTRNYWESSENGSNVDASQAEFIIDLDGTYDLSLIKVYPYWSGQRIYQYEVYTSTDNENWEKVGENTSDDYITSDGISHSVSAAASYIKIKGIKTSVAGRDDINNMHIIEVEAYGTASDTQYEEAAALLADAIALAESTDTSNSTPESAAAYQAAIDSAKAVLNNPDAASSDLFAAADALTAAADLLESSARKALLAQAVSQAQSLQEQGALDGVNEIAAEYFTNSLAEAEAILASGTASQEDVNTAWSNLSEAIQMLDFTSDKTELNALIAKAEGINEELDLYKDAGKEEFTAALDYAKEVSGSKTALTEVSIADAIARLESAIDNLEKLPEIDTELLEILLMHVEYTNKDLYKEEGWAEFESALADAKAVYENPADQESVDAAVAKLNSAWLNLRLLPDEKITGALDETENSDPSYSLIDGFIDDSFSFGGLDDDAFLVGTFDDVLEEIAGSIDTDSSAAEKVNPAASEETEETQQPVQVQEVSVTKSENGSVLSIANSSDNASKVSASSNTSNTSSTSKSSSSVSTGVKTSGFAALAAAAGSSFLLLLKRRKSK